MPTHATARQRVMILRRLPLVLTAVASLLGACARGRPASAGPTAHAPPRADVGTRGAEVLQWNRAQKLAGFPRMDSLFPAHVVARGARVRPLPGGAPLAPFVPGRARAALLDSLMVAQETAGLLVLHDGKVRLERYALGHSAAGRWTSFSVAKSITSTLVGAAIRDGYIKGLAEPITAYIPELRGSAYDGVTVRHLLTMTSGVAFNEDYADPDSDIARLYRSTPPPGMDATVSYMRTMPREAPPGTRWRYKTPETNLAGLLVMRATGKPLAEYLSEKIWRPYGMEREATWLVDGIGNEQGGCCLNATLRDFARFGQFILDGARVEGRPIVPDDWLATATTKQADIGQPGVGYGFQWWTSDDGTFHARGIFGQLIYVDPARRLVVAMASAWPVATGRAQTQARLALLAEIARAVDGTAAAR
jgi:CubicO group peptidase (beta-lactamase class C family)